MILYLIKKEKDLYQNIPQQHNNISFDLTDILLISPFDILIPT